MTPRADKRSAILDGALEVFARDGYTRAGIDVIAREAGVSTRTIYNHFQDKAALFQTVVSRSAEHVSAAHTAMIDTHFLKITDLEEDLTRLGLALLHHKSSHAQHFTLVRHIQADIEHIPPAVVQAWQETGPLHVRRHLAARLAALPSLHTPDPERAALHFLALISPDTAYNAPDPDEASTRAAVRTFLYGHHH